ncbi:TPA: MFS transporter [Listeria monocytogenes]
MTSTAYKGTNKLIVGIVFGVITFWLFAQSMVNIVPAVQSDLGISSDLLSIAISLTALFSGIFIVVAGGMADKFGRVKLTYIGLILSIIGSLLLVVTQGSTLLIIGRIIQGLSAACIMPATLALMKTYFDGADRQRALSYWSIGSWGGSGICSFAGGAIATYMGWRWIFIISIVFALLGMLLIKGTPESKVVQNTKAKFDSFGLVLFVIAMVCLNLIITRGATFGWTSPITITMLVVFLVSAGLFFRVELRQANGFIDFSLFKNKAYTGATLSNFLLNAAAGTLVVANTYVQIGRGFTAFQSGLLSIGYLVCVLGMIRIGEKILQRVGARKPMILGSGITAMEAMFSVTVELTYTNDYPPLYNDPAVTEQVVASLQKGVGEYLTGISEYDMLSGSEDFAYYLQKIPGVFFYIGAKPKNTSIAYFNHHPKFDIDEDALLVAAKSVADVVLDYYKLNG